MATKRPSSTAISKDFIKKEGDDILLKLSWQHSLTGFLIVLGIFQSPAVPIAFSIPLLIFSMVYIAYFFGDFWYRSYQTLHRDLSGLHLILQVKFDLWKRMKENKSIGEIWGEMVEKFGDKTAFFDIETGRKYSFRQFDAHANRYANFYQTRGLRAGDVIAIHMENSSDFVAAWLGAAKVGVVTAWINSNLRKEPLAHCVHTSEAKAAITSQSLQFALLESISSGHLSMSEDSLWVLGSPIHKDSLNLSRQLDVQSTRKPAKIDDVTFKSVLCFIYTSGTTGLPKAAVMKHFRYYSMVMGAALAFGLRPSDRLYVSLPIYHTAAGILGIGQCLVRGSSCVIRRKFSASNFWKDCKVHECTASQYIGEICRYLLAQPGCVEESTHKMRIMYGNGLRAEIWQSFVDRFGVKIGEVYGSTEGTSNLVNIDGHVGACGFLPISPLTKKMHPVRLVKVNTETGEILRRPNGLCVACRPGETGAMVSTIRADNPLLQFEGYLNRKETDSKIIRDVFAKGDSCFVSGDLLHWDRLGYVYFKDRTGDTFRWKGENVSTTEVEAILHPTYGVADATVYGVTVPGNEGRAGMAAVVRTEGDERSEMSFLDTLADRLLTSLPSYAVPRFIRLCPHVDKTGTYKLVKTNLQRLSYGGKMDGHRLFILNSKLRAYELLDDETIKAINEAQYANI
ncbi:unnamed protein product, partial [Mesorhabditis belari]|uniref:Very long-chain fatty acid transport protein n=1 Tax=Mesorhabditis belari TaxID=2138241 RepID=A0AAF3FHM7_9BILA